MSRSEPQDGPALAREVFAVIDAGDLERTAALLDDSFRLHYHGVPDAISKETLLQMTRGYYDSFPVMRHDLLEVLPSGNYVTVRLVVYATHGGTYEGIAATGRQVAVSAIHILRVADGRIVEWWAAEDDLGLLRQIGAIMTPPGGASPAAR
ncbi:MAG: ester cyclase [Acidobacteriota bacterium]